MRTLKVFVSMLLITATCFLVGCVRQGSISVLKNLDAIELAADSSVTVPDSYFISIDALADNYIVSYYRDSLFFGILNSSFEEVCKFARHGNGAGEYIAPYYAGQPESDGQMCSFNIIELPKGRVDRYIYDASDKSVQLQESLQVPKKFSDLRNAYKTPSGYFLAMNDKTQDVNVSDASLINFKKVDLPDRNAKGVATEQVYQTRSCIRPDCSRVAMSYFSIPRIDIVQADGTHLKTVYVGNRNRPTAENYDMDFFCDIACTQDSVYAIMDYQGGKSLLLCIDWDGNLLGAYIIRNAYSIAVRGSDVICLSEEEDDIMAQFYRFK